MIIGNGDIASVLTDREDRIYFASGVSNSQETRRSEYEREKKLLLSQDRYRHLVYFSSLCVFYSDTLYAQHKIRMERLVRERFKHYTIIRLGNITWGKNPHTIINFFKDKLKRGEEIEIRNTYRYLTDPNELLHWIDMIPDWNCEINIPGRRLLVSEIVEEIKKERL
jgi:nucleoside-diphosphate-sugar epimerase